MWVIVVKYYKLSYNLLMLEFRNVTKYYHSYRAVEYLNHKFTSNRIAVYGVEGSGKSTVLRLVSGVEKCTEGEILLFNKQVEISKDVFFTFRDGGLLKNKTVRENLLFPLKIRDVKNAENIVNSSIEEFDLQEIKDCKLSHISFSERARIILAKLKLRKTKMMLIDNPFENLDTEQRAEYFNWFLDIIKDYKGIVIYATDNKQEIESFNEVILLNYGFVKGYGNINDVFTNPYNIFIYSFYEQLKLFNGMIFKEENTLYFTDKVDKIKINDAVSARIIPEFIPMECILAIKPSSVEKLGKTVEELKLLDLEDSTDIWLFDWNENSIIK